MAEHKRQHYVPKCHFKPFSQSGEGNSINLYNIVRDKFVDCAPVKGQCAKDYMYGQNLNLEKAFQQIEGNYARVTRMIEANPETASGKDLEIIRFFAALQHFRTETAMNRMLAFHKDLTDTIFDRESPSQAAHRPPIPDDREIMRSTLTTGIRTAAIIKDLEGCIVLNRTKCDFVTSDDPAIFTSRYYFQRLKSTNFGYASSGAMLVLPISPRSLIMFYDRNVYVTPNKIGKCIELKKASDVSAFNELQFLKAARNIYFSNCSQAEQIKSEFNQVKSRRPAGWSAMTVFVPDEFAPHGTKRYRRATEKEERTAPSSLVCASATYPRPSRWPSILSYRMRPISYSNGSAIGNVRKAEWLTRRGINREFSMD